MKYLREQQLVIGILLLQNLNIERVISVSLLTKPDERNLISRVIQWRGSFLMRSNSTCKKGTKEPLLVLTGPFS